MSNGGRGRRLAIIRNSGAATVALLVAACGGGGGGVSSPGTSAPSPAPTPAPSPTPTSAPTPTPTPTSSAATAEYRASAAAVGANAAYAFDRGITGRGVTIAVIDSGIAAGASEFAGRVSADSTGFEQRIARCGTCASETVAPFPIADVDGHGTEVASIAAAARDGSGMLGLAPGATVLALKVSGPDLEGVTAGSTTPIRESRSPSAGLIAPALRLSVEKGAFVTVMSLNGFAGGLTAVDQRAAMDAVRAADRLLVESVSNDIGQDSFAGQFAENLVGTDRANKDWFLFAIAVNADGTSRSGNGNAGALADRMIAAVGNGVQVVLKDGSYGTVTGNSFAAPAVGGAAALLRERWPLLGGRAIARILLDTATDMGAPGVDAVYGVGLLNVEKAMQAQASTASFSAAAAELARYSSLSVPAAFGGAATATSLGRQVGSMTVFDRYGRDFRMTAPASVRARSSGLLAGAFAGSSDPVAATSFATRADARLGFADAAPVGPWQGSGSGRPAHVAFSPATGQTVSLGANVAVGGSGGASLGGSYLRTAVTQPVGFSSSWSGGGWSASFSDGRSRDRGAKVRGTAFLSPAGFGLELTQLRERGRVLGLEGAGTLGLVGGSTTLATVSTRRAVAGVALTARATMGSTRPDTADGLVRFSGRLVTSAFAVEGAKPLLGGVASLGLSSPLRVERARASLLVPIAYDLESGATLEERRSFDLSPSSREIDFELGWSAALPALSPGSTIRLGVARAFDAGHVRGASDAAAFVAFAIR